MKRRGFTLFEVLAVLTVISIGLMVIVGAYGSWGTAHALNGAAHTVEAGLQQARTLAMTQRAYVAVSYGSMNAASSALSRTTGFQPFFCTNNNDTAVSETDLNDLSHALDNDATFIPSDGVLFNNVLVIDPAAPFQRLSGHVRLARLKGDLSTSPLQTASVSIIVFRPDGSVIPDDFASPSPSNSDYHDVILETTESFSVSPTATAPLVRILRIDPSTGLVTLLGGAP